MFGTASEKYRPLQLYQLAQKGLDCEIIDPPPEIRNTVYYYWILRVTEPKVSLPVIPDGATDLVLSPDIENFSALYFPQIEKFHIPLTGPVCFVGVCIRTECLGNLFPLEMRELKSLQQGKESTSALALENMVGELQGKKDTREIEACLNREMLELVASGQILESDTIFSVFLKSVESERIPDIAKKVNLSERQFRRLTEGVLGLSPKKLQRITRLQEVLGQFFSANLSDIADGFHDESHMIRELKQLTGLTPGQIRKMAEKYNQSVS